MALTHPTLQERAGLSGEEEPGHSTQIGWSAQILLTQGSGFEGTDKYCIDSHSAYCGLDRFTKFHSPAKSLEFIFF